MNELSNEALKLAMHSLWTKKAMKPWAVDTWDQLLACERRVEELLRCL